MPLPPAQVQPDLRLNDREQIQYLLGNPPSWMMRYGITVMAGFFMLILTLSYFIRYPDIIEAKVILVTANPPIRILAKSSGPVSELLVSDQQQVKAGQVLAVIANSADWKDVILLESWLSTAHTNSAVLPSELQLGALQDAYSTFTQHWKDYQYFYEHNGVAEKIAFLQKQIEQINALNVSLVKQKLILSEEFVFAEKEINRKRQLHSSQVIADVEIEMAEKTFLQQKRQLESTEAASLQNQMQIRQIESQINDLQQSKGDDSVGKALTLDEDLRRLQSAVEEWKQNYLVLAPISGKVSFSKIWSVQQSIGAGEEIMAVVPNELQGENKSNIVGKATLPATNAGKIQSGMRAIIRLDGLPAQEYGSLEAEVAHIALLPQKDEYLLDLNISDARLTTTYGKQIAFRQEMTGQVRIITEERRVVERIFDRLNDLLKNR
ncbi:MAG: HlyD family efflux transporter periplasmic adaptor subunit [Saprospiraceae bacterium]|nr:HlyD family efflux transporter periplasmic adaptor subunit [Saprospiraceae bacterium]